MRHRERTRGSWNAAIVKVVSRSSWLGLIRSKAKKKEKKRKGRGSARNCPQVAGVTISFFLETVSCVIGSNVC